MSAQDKTEQVLRDIYILLSQCEVYDKETSRIIVNKTELLKLLKNLNTSIYGIMEEYEMTQRSRDAAERKIRKQSEEIVADATHKAEDVYAASVLYTDEALQRVQGIMQEATDSVKEIYDKMNQQLQREKETVHRDQYELKGLLEGMADSNKYLRLIEDRNRQIQKDKAKEAKEPEVSRVRAPKPEIRINKEYFEKAGISLEADAPEEEAPEEKKAPVTPEVKVNFNAEYFKQKENPEEILPEEENPEQEEAQSKKTERRPLFGKARK